MWVELSLVEVMKWKVDLFASLFNIT